jgi:hypothetical protein
MNFSLYFIAYMKINSKWILDLNIMTQILQPRKI